VLLPKCQQTLRRMVVAPLRDIKQLYLHRHPRLFTGSIDYSVNA
jgi:hypothetical protein